MSANSASSSARLMSGNRCSLPVAVVSVVVCLFLLQLYTLLPQKDAFKLDTRILTSKSFRELEEVDEENIQVPPPRKRSPRAIKRKPKKPTTIIEEFLDETSQMRHVFFPDIKTAIDPNKGNDSFYYHPGRIWLDTEGNPIQAHGGGILYDDRSETYYWYGEYKDGPTYHAHKKGAARVDIIGVGCYSSKDLWTWKNEGIVLAAEENDETHDLHKSNVLERPKVLYNENTGKYVMWMHIDDTNYTKAHVGVAVSDYPNQCYKRSRSRTPATQVAFVPRSDTRDSGSRFVATYREPCNTDPNGPFEYLYSKNPHGFDSRDMTVFRDDDGVAYLIYSSVENSELHVSPLTKDYLDVSNIVSPVLIGHHREAPALFKHQGTYYMITSGCTGWAPNEALAHASDSIMGPWETMGNPCLGGNKIFRETTFFAQSTFVLPLKGLPNYYIFMADRWNPADLRDSRYVWLPLKVAGPVDQPLDYDFGFPLWPRVSIFWHKRWRLPFRLSG